MRRLWAGWCAWAFTPVDPAPMAALRVLVGLLAAGWALSLLPDAAAFLGPDSLQPGLPPVSGGAWVVPLGPPLLAPTVLLLAAVALVLGWRTRVASVFVAVLLLAVQRRDPWVLNSGDLLLRELALFVALMPAGETWSLDARRRGVSRPRAPWALRLAQLQVSALYLSSVWAKVRGEAWNDGTAVGSALQIGDLQRLVLPDALTQSLLLSGVLTYASLAVELALAVCLWLPRARWPAMLAGVALHLGIEATLLVGWFSLAVVSSYVVFVPAEHLRRAGDAVRSRVLRRRPAGVRSG